MDTTLEAGQSLVRAGKVSGQTLAILMPRIMQIVQTHPQGILDMASVTELQTSLETEALTTWVAGDENELHLVALTQTSMFKANPTLFVIWVGGEEFTKYGPPLLEVAEKWAVTQNIKQISFSGRRGWEKVLKPLGFSAPRIEMVKPVGWMLSDDNQFVRRQ